MFGGWFTRSGGALLAAAILLDPCFSPAQDCLDYSDYLHWVSCETQVNGVGVTVVGDLAYVSATAEGLIIFNIGDPAHPVRLGTADTPGSCLGNVVVGNLAYVADGYAPGFGVIDVGDPSAPRLLGTAGYSAGYYYDLAMVAPDTFWVCDGNYGIAIYEANNPEEPQYLGRFQPGGSPWGLEVLDGKVYLADDFGLKVYDISTSALEPELIGFAADADNNYGVKSFGDVMYVMSYGGISVMDISDPAAPFLVGEYPDAGTSFRMAIDGSLGYVSEGSNTTWHGLEVVDLGMPTAPTHHAGLPTGWECYDVALAGDFALTTVERTGLFVADRGNPAGAPRAGWLDMATALEVAVAGRYAYVANGYPGLYVVDLADAAAPDSVGVYDPAAPVNDVVLQGGRAYLGVDSAGLQIVDLADPVAPVLLGAVNPLGSVTALAVQGDWVYLAARDYGVQIIDAGEVATPIQRATLDLPDWPLNLVARGQYLYVACRQSGLQVADISDPWHPALVGELDLPDDALAVALQDDLAFLCCDEAGLCLVDITDPTAPVLVSTLRTPGMATDAVADSNLVYIMDGPAGLQVADISDPAHPRLAGSLELPNPMGQDIALADNCICLADWIGGFTTAWRQCRDASPAPEVPPASPISLTARPNPFNAHTRLTYDLPVAGRLDLKIYDVGGRLVRVLLADSFTADRVGSVDWDGRDTKGRTVAAGVYLCRLETRGQSATARVVLVK